jgi:hypothetical protein
MNRDAILAELLSFKVCIKTIAYNDRRATRAAQTFLRPAFERVEGDDAERVSILAVQQIEDHGFQIGRLDFGFR